MARLLAIALYAFLCAPFVLAESQIRLLTEFAGEDREPALSKDGKWLAYLSDRKNNRNNELWLLNMESGVRRALHTEHAVLGPPVWHAGDTAIVVSLKVAEEPARIHAVDVTTGNVSPPLVPANEYSGDQLFPDLSPDGKRIAYTVRTEDGGLDLFITTLANGAVSRLTTNPQNDLWPRFAPDGTGLYFFSRRDTEGEADDIYFMTLRTRTIRRLTTADDHDFVPAPSYGNHRIAFASRRNGSPKLFVMRADGSLQSEVETPGLTVTHPVWALGGSHVIATVRPETGGSADIALIRLP